MTQGRTISPCSVLGKKGKEQSVAKRRQGLDKHFIKIQFHGNRQSSSLKLAFKISTRKRNNRKETYLTNSSVYGRPMSVAKGKEGCVRPMVGKVCVRMRPSVLSAHVLNVKTMKLYTLNLQHNAM